MNFLTIAARVVANLPTNLPEMLAETLADLEMGGLYVDDAEDLIVDGMRKAWADAGYPVTPNNDPTATSASILLAMSNLSKESGMTSKWQNFGMLLRAECQRLLDQHAYNGPRDDQYFDGPPEPHDYGQND